MLLSRVREMAEEGDADKTLPCALTDDEGHFFWLGENGGDSDMLRVKAGDLVLSPGVCVPALSE